MGSHYRMRDEDEYEHEDYDEYEEDASGEEEEEEEAPLSQEQQEFLKLREELKEKYREKLKKEAVSAFGRSQSQDKRRTTNDNFGSFFGPSQPVIASRVLDECRSIRETQHIISRIPTASSGNGKDTSRISSEKKTVVHKQQPKVVNEVKKKAQTLKDMRDYSFLLSDDADFPDAKEGQRPARKVPAFDGGHLGQASGKSKPQITKPAMLVHDGHGLKNPGVKKLQSQPRVGPGSGGNGAALNRHTPATTVPRKIDNSRNDTGRTVVQKALPSKVPTQATSTSKPPAKVLKDPHLKNKPSTTAPHSSVQKNHYPHSSVQKNHYPHSSVQRNHYPHSSVQKNHYPDQRRPSQSLNNIRSMPNKPLPSSKSQLMKPPKKIPPRDSHEDRLKKKPVKRRLDDDDDEDAIGMIRKMFGYNPAKYSGVDEDVSDMEADFREIQKEERRSALIARKEDEEQLRLIEEEERRERMRKKQKLKRQ